MLKAIEHIGRRLLLRLLGSRRLIAASHLDAPRSILVIRIDPRVGNVVMLTAFLDELHRAYPSADVTLLGPSKGQALLANAPYLSTFWAFNKKRLSGQDGWLRTLKRLRQKRFDLIIDAANPTSPSTTQSILALTGNAPTRLGFQPPNGQSPYELSAPPLANEESHENLQRLQLLKALGHTVVSPRLPDLSHVVTPQRQRITAWLEATEINTFTILNIGARLSEKQLSSSDYRSIIQALEEAAKSVIVTFGPSEESLAQQSASGTGAILGPATTLVELADLFHRADAVVSCDTGPMHLAVAVGSPTCGIFVATSPERYGYQGEGHCRLDARSGLNTDHLEAIKEWWAESAVEA